MAAPCDGGRWYLFSRALMGAGRYQAIPLASPECESDWDPRVLLTLETRMEHGKHWSAAEAAEVSRRAS